MLVGRSPKGTNGSWAFHIQRLLVDVPVAEPDGLQPSGSVSAFVSKHTFLWISGPLLCYPVNQKRPWGEIGVVLPPWE